MSNSILPCLLGCSPRAIGNSSTAADLFYRELGADPEVIERRSLKDHTVLPCVACGRCSRHPGSACPFEQRDTSGPLLRSLAAAPALCLVSPIYFYHLPAQFKALVDRTQPWWEAKRQGVDMGIPRRKRPAWLILLAARPKGERLFEGSLLTLRYCFDALGIKLMEPLCLYGLDAPGDLAADPESRAAVSRYARNARSRFLGLRSQG